MTHITVRAIHPNADITTISNGQLYAACKLHYQVLRSADAQVDEELRLIQSGRREKIGRLLRLIKRRDQAQTIHVAWIAELCRRIREDPGLSDWLSSRTARIENASKAFPEEAILTE